MHGFPNGTNMQWWANYKSNHSPKSQIIWQKDFFKSLCQITNQI